MSPDNIFVGFETSSAFVSLREMGGCKETAG